MEVPTAVSTNVIIEDSVQAGLLEVLGCSVIPESDTSGHVYFRIVGDVDGCLTRLYGNEPVGALDCLKGIKAMRQALFSLRRRRTL